MDKLSPANFHKPQFQVDYSSKVRSTTVKTFREDDPKSPRPWGGKAFLNTTQKSLGKKQLQHCLINQ